MDLKTAIHEYLRSDSTLISLLDSPTAQPYEIYKSFPKMAVKIPFITFREIGRTGDFPTSIVFGITAWAKNPDLILNRVRTLMEKHIFSCDEFRDLCCFYEGGNQESFDEDKKCYYRQDRYLIKVLVI